MNIIQLFKRNAQAFASEMECSWWGDLVACLSIFLIVAIFILTISVLEG